MIDGIGIGGYRSYGDMQFVAPMGKVTLLAGQNNAGKSNIIRFLSRHLGAYVDDVTGSDKAKVGDHDLALAVAWRVPRDLAPDQWSTVNPALTSRQPSLLGFFESPVFRATDDDLVWVRYRTRRSENPQAPLMAWEVDPDWLKDVPGAEGGYKSSNPYRQAAEALSSDNLSGIEGGTDFLHRLFPLHEAPKVEVIEAFRQVREGEDGPQNHSGVNLIKRLAALKDPDDIDRWRVDRARFERINHFAQTVLEDPTVRIDIPRTHDRIFITQQGLTHPLDDMGTGIHQVIILAAAATLLSKTLVCIEEPEVHLHPLLQRKLVRYLHDETDNQYLIATHSAHLLDYERAEVIHVQKRGNRSTTRRVTSGIEASALCVDLGYRPSDLIQANCVIWVEGPSDRIYVRAWLTAASDQPLVEGVHYSIMFYGGRLLNALTSADPSADAVAEDLIKLRPLNRNSVVLIDSDKTAPGTRLNATKTRIQREYIESGERPGASGFAWVTSGNTVENYVPPALLGEAVQAVHAKADISWSGERWTNPLTGTTGAPRTVDKVAIAKAVADRWRPDEHGWPLDLRKQARRLADFVEQANGL